MDVRISKKIKKKKIEARLINRRGVEVERRQQAPGWHYTSRVNTGAGQVITVGHVFFTHTRSPLASGNMVSTV